MKALLLALLSLVALGCGSAEPVSASPDAAGDVVSADVAEAGEDAPTAPQEAAVAVMPDAAPEASVIARDVMASTDVPRVDDAAPLRAVEVPDAGGRPCATVRDCGTLRPSLVPSCQAGQCVDMCPAEFADCDGNPINGCETRLDRAEACGACDRWCGRGGACVRFAGWFRCA